MSTHVLPFSPLTTLIRLVPTCQISHTTQRLSNGLPCKFIIPLVRKPPASLPPLQVPNPKEPTHTMPSRRRYITTHTPSGLSIFSPPLLPTPRLLTLSYQVPLHRLRLPRPSHALSGPPRLRIPHLYAPTTQRRRDPATRPPSSRTWTPTQRRACTAR